ncbi:CASP8 and FADD-like apoptosis regulator [Sinocyclocheilus grahami]|uniref:CASP8 and FADD-like apoptosis regulator n=1 Tax=Sinocyclocheilus grahami TaxID=75366 RepID=UPI0007AD2DE2|nr:PREDICTED: CASP8 and FADD-like apoptosis regulator [Sinocyclocheilus grahami]
MPKISTHLNYVAEERSVSHLFRFHFEAVKVSLPLLVREQMLRSIRRTAPWRMSGLYHTISQITDELSTDECKRISYLCGALDMDKFSTDPRGMLQSVLCQTRMDYVFLMELILKIKRYDLLRQVLSTNKSTVEGLLKNGHSVSEYRVLMADVSEDMGTEDLKSLKFLLRGTLPKHKLENAQSFLDIAVELEKLDQLSSEKMDLIEQCLRSIHRADLAKKISHYQQTALMTKQGSSPPDRRQFCRMPLPNSSFGVSTASCNVRPISKFCGEFIQKRTVRGNTLPGKSLGKPLIVSLYIYIHCLPSQLPVLLKSSKLEMAQM